MGLFSLASFLVVNSLGTLYPVYLSYKAIKNNDLPALEVLLMFWIVMGITTAIENTFGWLLHWVPFFYQAKSCFIIWLTLPQIQGSTYVYVTYVHPFLLEHEPAIDGWLANVQENLKQSGTDYFYHLAEKLKEIILGVLASSPPPPYSSAPQANHPSTRQTAVMEGASAYTANLLRQWGPTAAAIFQPMQNRLPDPLFMTRALHRDPSSSSQFSRDDPNGYQIPDYDDVSLLHTGRGSRSGEPSIRRKKVSSDSLRTQNCNRQTSGSWKAEHTSSSQSRANLGGMVGYDENSPDEASGSESEWLMRQPPSNLPATTSRTQLVAQGAAAEDDQGTSLSPAQPLLDKTLNTSTQTPSSGSAWFKWGSKPR